MVESKHPSPAGRDKEMRTKTTRIVNPRRLLERFAIFTILIFAIVMKPQGLTCHGQWQPPGALSGGHYVGSKICASCHSNRIRDPARYSHGTNPEPDCQLPGVAVASPPQRSASGRYSYQIISVGGKSTYIVSDGVHTTQTQALTWAGLGQGRGGQSYLYNRDGVFYEARVSYFSELGNLDLTLRASAR